MSGRRDGRQCHLRAVELGDRDGSVEGHDRRGVEADELVVEGDDLRPVGVIRLTRLIRALMPEDGEVAGLLALMLLTEARRTARVSASGELVALDEQDRGAWDAALIAEGHRLVRERLAAGVAPGRYQILAAINAVHTSARDVRASAVRS